MYIADKGNNRIRKVTVSTGIITTIAGTGTGSYSGDGGDATSATLNGPYGVAVDASGRIRFYSILLFLRHTPRSDIFSALGNVYIAEYSNCRIRKVTISTSMITTIAGNGTASFSGDDGAATSATLYLPNGVALDASGRTRFDCILLLFFLTAFRD